jgi:hypothetical protein
MCECIWYVKRVTGEDSNIAYLERTFRDRALTWYMEYKTIVLVGRERSLMEIKRDILRKFHEPKLESQCINKIKDIKQQAGESVWDYDQWFNFFLDSLTFQIQDIHHREWFIAGILAHIDVFLT